MLYVCHWFEMAHPWKQQLLQSNNILQIFRKGRLPTWELNSVFLNTFYIIISTLLIHGGESRGGDRWLFSKYRLNLYVPNLGENTKVTWWRNLQKHAFLRKVICRYFSVQHSSSKRRKLLNVINIFHVFCKLWTSDTQACSNIRTRICRI